MPQTVATPCRVRPRILGESSMPVQPCAPAVRGVAFHFISHTHTLRRIQTCAMNAIKDAGQAVASQGTLWHESIKRDTFFQAPRPPATIPQDSWAYPAVPGSDFHGRFDDMPCLG